MVAGKIRHWKHGWIPISPEAKAYVAGKGPRPVTGTDPDLDAALKRSKARQAAWKHLQEQRGKVEAASGIKSQRVGGFRLTTVDGYPEVYFQEVLELDKRPPEQYREVAQIVHDALKPYPRAVKTNPVEIGFSNELMPSVMADTNNGKPHKIRVNVDMWDRPALTMQKAIGMRESHFGMTGEADDIEQFRKNVITHELGHELHMRDLDEMSSVPMSQAGDPHWGAIEQFTQEPVTLREMGITHIDGGGEDYEGGPLDQQHERWEVDSLHGQSAYATTNNFEFFAEAFLDGTIHGDKATESGKRAVAIARKVFGPGSPTVRERLYGKEAAA